MTRASARPTLAQSVLLAVLATSLTAPLAAQEPPAAPREQREARGRVVLPRDSGEVSPVAGAWVTLHRIAAQRAGPVDSVRTDADGRYRFVYATSADDAATWVASATRAGIAHFSAPLGTRDAGQASGEIVVFDTTSAAPEVHVRGRHLVVFAARPGGRREVMEVYEIENHGLRTVVPRGDTAAVWSAPLPRGARDIRAGDGILSDDAVRFRDGRAELVAPFSPGLQQLSIRYTLPAGAFPLSLALREDAEFLEVLVEDPLARVTGAGLVEVESHTVEGHALRRFLSRRVPAGAALTVTLPGGGQAQRGSVVAVLVAATVVAMSAAMAVALRRPSDLPRVVLAAQRPPG